MTALFLPIAKVDRAERMVWGYASTPTRDLDGEVVALAAIKDALPGYMQWRNVREMHQPSAVGVAKEASVDETGLYLGAKIVDDDAWRKVLEDVYKGFSIGGTVTDRDGSTITGLELIEISLVDRPANPDCRIEVIKAAGHAAAGVTLAREEVGLIGRLLAKLAGVGGGPSAGRGPSAEKRGREPIGDIEYADPGYREDGRKRYPIDTEAHIRAAWSYIHEERNAAEYTAEELTAIKRRIVAAWKRTIDAKGPPAAAEAATGVSRDGAREVSHEGGEAEGLTDAAEIWSGVTRMAEGGLGKRAASGAQAGHLKKAMEHLGEAHKCVGAGMACVARAHEALEDAEKAADGFSAPAHLSRAAEHFTRAAEHHVLAHHHMAAAGGAAAARRGERGEEPLDAEPGIYEPEGGLAPLTADNMTEGRVPGYDADMPYPGKAASVLALKAAQDALVKKAEEAAYLRGKIEALEKMPANPRAKLFAVPRGALGVSEADEPSAMEKLLKGVNLDAVEPAQRQAAGARLIGNMIANAGTFARPVIGDPSFRGGAGR